MHEDRMNLLCVIAEKFFFTIKKNYLMFKFSKMVMQENTFSEFFTVLS